MKFLTRKRTARLSTGATFVVLTLALSAPGIAEGGCSHLVNSRADSWQLPSLIDPLAPDLSGQSEKLPVSSPRRPCSGALCSGQPAAPAVPSVAVEGRPESCVWYPSTLHQIPVPFAFSTSETSARTPCAGGAPSSPAPTILSVCSAKPSLTCVPRTGLSTRTAPHALSLARDGIRRVDDIARGAENLTRVASAGLPIRPPDADLPGLAKVASCGFECTLSKRFPKCDDNELVSH